MADSAEVKEGVEESLSRARGRVRVRGRGREERRREEKGVNEMQ